MSEERGWLEDAPPKQDTGLCCLCAAPRANGFRYLCLRCSDTSIDRALRTEVAIAAVRERRVCEPVGVEA